MNWGALALGLFSVGMIGFGFLWVIQLEYHLGYLWWPYPLLMGVLLAASSLLVSSAAASALLGIAGASLIWGATELRDQAVRAKLRWFKTNPHPKPAPPLAALIRKIKPPHL